jgi:hypothetical protein
MPAKKVGRSTRKKTRNNKPTVHQLRVTLRESTPPIWRRFVVSSQVDLGTLHAILQTVMDWTNSHLHQFSVDGQRISDPAFELDEFEEEERTLDEYATRLRDIAPNVGDRFDYWYDFGDNWHHDVEVEAVHPLAEHAVPLWCLDGARACPPDDCGGIRGYEDFLAAIADPEHPDHNQMTEWIGGEFDSEAFDRRLVNRELARWILSQD